MRRDRENQSWPACGRARKSGLDPIRVPPYGPAANTRRIERPDTRKHLTACPEPSEEMLASKGRPHTAMTSRGAVHLDGNASIRSPGMAIRGWVNGHTWAERSMPADRANSAAAVTGGGCISCVISAIPLNPGEFRIKLKSRVPRFFLFPAPLKCGEGTQMAPTFSPSPPLIHFPQSPGTRSARLAPRLSARGGGEGRGEEGCSVQAIPPLPVPLPPEGLRGDRTASARFSLHHRWAAGAG